MKTGEEIRNKRRALGRLPKAVSVLEEEVPKWLDDGASFDLNLWGVGAELPTSFSGASRCGFSGCSIGWLSLHPFFRRAGLKAECEEWREGPDKMKGLVFHIDRIADVFGISSLAASAIFGNRNSDWPFGHGFINNDLSAATARIRRFCEDQGIPVAPAPGSAGAVPPGYLSDSSERIRFRAAMRSHGAASG